MCSGAHLESGGRRARAAAHGAHLERVERVGAQLVDVHSVGGRVGLAFAALVVRAAPPHRVVDVR